MSMAKSGALALLPLVAAFCLNGFRGGAVAEEPAVSPPFEAAARVRVQFIEHSLLASDVRRVEFGAPMPIIPYKTRLDILALYPQAQARRMTLEGIVSTTWMPEKDDKGFLLLKKSGDAYTAAASFPVEGYYPIVVRDGEERVEFPTNSGRFAAPSLVWECLCDIIEASQSDAAALSTKWNQRLQDESVETMLVALVFLLQAPTAAPDWDALFKRLAPSPSGGPLNEAAPMLARLIPDEQADALADLFLAALQQGVLPLGPQAYADGLITLAMRKHPPARLEAINRLLLREYADPSGNQRLIQRFQQIAPALRECLDADINEFLGQMLTEPWRFPCMRTRGDLEELWQVMAKRNHEGLAPWLRDFLKQPTAEFLRLPINPLDMQQLMTLARQLLTVPTTDESS